FETAASSLSSAEYLLENHRGIQRKEREEVGFLLERDGDTTYDNIFSLRHLKQVIAESLRRCLPQPG
ncbi:hypothetical protein HPB47_008796, partial [Ixodes persulcatus]